MSDQATEPTQSQPPAAPSVETPAVEPVAPRTSPLSVYTGLTVEARLYANESRWVFGVELDGAFVPIADRRMGGVLDDIQEALTPGFKAKRAEQYARDVLGR